jgi:hypothetical protein
MWFLASARRSGLDAGIDLAAWLVAVALASSLAGRLVWRSIGRRDLTRAGELTSLLIGWFAVSAAMTALTWFAALRPTVSFAVTAGATGIAYALAVFRGRRAWRPRPRLGHIPGSLLVLSLATAAGLLWSQDCLQPWTQEGGRTLFVPWNDMWIHSKQVTLLKYADFQAGRYNYAGARVFFYHYGSYLIPALLARASSLSSLEATTNLWVPTGAMLCWLSVFCSCRLLFREGPSLAAMVLVMTLPDVSSLVFANRFLSFHWLQQVGPGLYYGVALSSLSLALALRGLQRRSVRSVLLAWALAGALVGFRAHLVPVTAGALLALQAAFFPWSPRRIRLLLPAVVASSGAAGLAIVYLVSITPTLTGRFALREYLALMARQSAWDAGLAKQAAAMEGPSGLVLLAGLYLLISMGVGLVSYPLAGAVAPRRVRWSTRLLPLLVLAVYCATVVSLPLNERNGNRFELHHRPFVLPHLLLSAWAWAMLASRVERSLPGIARRPVRWAASLATPVLLIVPLVLGDGFHHIHGRMIHSRSPVQAGKLALARYLRAHSGPREVFADLDKDPREMVVALSERRSFLSRPRIHGLIRLPGIDLAAREATLQAIGQAGTRERLVGLLRRHGIDWVIVGPGHDLGWPADLRRRAAFASGGHRLYRTRDLLAPRPAVDPED